MNESIIIQKMISIGQHLEREEIFYSGAEADARALLNEIKQALTIPAVVGQSEQLKCEHKGRRTATELVEYCEDCKKILFHP
jgi:hypothetical protein